MNKEESIQYLLEIVKDLKAKNEELINKINILEEKYETLDSEVNELDKEITILNSKEPISMEEMCEYVEGEINNISPLKEGWKAVYSEKAKCMGYFNNRNKMLNEPPTILFWDRTEYTKKQVICVSDE